MRRLGLAALVAIVLGVPAGAIGHTTGQGKLYVSKAKWGSRWPFTVRWGVLACQGSSKWGQVTFTTPSGRRYAVNGVALTNHLPDPHPIWRNDPSAPGLGLKVNMGPMLERGLRLCG